MDINISSFDVKGAFNAEWWPAVLKAMEDFHCPRNLYNLTQNYFSESSAFISTNNMRIDTTANKVCPQGSCCGAGYWKIQYNSQLNLNCTKWTRAIAFANDLLIVAKAATVVEMENYANNRNEQNYNMFQRKSNTFQRPKIKSYADIKKRKRKESNGYIPKQQPSSTSEQDKILGHNNMK